MKKLFALILVLVAFSLLPSVDATAQQNSDVQEVPALVGHDTSEDIAIDKIEEAATP